MIRDPQLAHVVHYVFEWAALVTGFWFYRRIRQSKGQSGILEPTAFLVVLGCIVGAAIGNKLVFWLEFPHLWAAHAADPMAWLMGQSIVGGLLGGWIGVELGKKVAGVTTRTGDDFVIPILFGILIGRIGCFLAGLNDGTYGVATTLPWGVDFGDGVSRHPTQLYEWLLAAAALLTYARWSSPLRRQAGLAFRVFMLGYLCWRFLSEFIKPNPYAYPLGWSGIQWVCLLAILIIGTHLVRTARPRTNH